MAWETVFCGPESLVKLEGLHFRILPSFHGIYASGRQGLVILLSVWPQLTLI